jgi:hypothetical protein
MISHLFITGFLLGLQFDPEDGDTMFLQNTDGFIPNYMAL